MEIQDKQLPRSLFGRGPRRRRALPLPVFATAVQPSRIYYKMPKAFLILEDIVEHILSDMHSIQKHLLFWQSKAEATDSQKLYFMIFQRGPRAFAQATYQTLARFWGNTSPVNYLLQSAEDLVSEKLAALTSMQHCLAAFLAEVYCKVHKCKEGLNASSDKSMHTLFIVLNHAFSNLEVALTNARMVCKRQTESWKHDEKPSGIFFETLPRVDVQSSNWTVALSTAAISSIYQNLRKLDDFLFSELSSHKKPSIMTKYWLPYTCALGLSACSLWHLSHSHNSLVGSSYIGNWIDGAKGFWDVHVEKPIISIRDQLLETFKNGGKRVMEKQDDQQNNEMLRRRLLSFCQRTSNEKLPQDISMQALTQIFMEGYRNAWHWMHPVRNSFGEELAFYMFGQCQKQMLDLKKTLLDAVYKATVMKFAILSALPVIGLPYVLRLLVQPGAIHDQSAVGRGKSALQKRTLLLLHEAERGLTEFENSLVKGTEDEAHCNFGLALYALAILYETVESHAKETAEWPSLRKNIVDLARPNISTRHKLVVLSGVKAMCACILR